MLAREGAMSISNLSAPVQQAVEVELDAGIRVFSQGQSAENFVVVTEGCVTVFARSDDGKEVVLYRVRPGELCILTTACVIGHTPSSSTGKRWPTASDYALCDLVTDSINGPV
jgi:CRP/FNR family transcriptional regulator